MKKKKCETAECKHLANRVRGERRPFSERDLCWQILLVIKIIERKDNVFYKPSVKCPVIVKVIAHDL